LPELPPLPNIAKKTKPLKHGGTDVAEDCLPKSNQLSFFVTQCSNLAVLRASVFPW
jgi:hypothetical protein